MGDRSVGMYVHFFRALSLSAYLVIHHPLISIHSLPTHTGDAWDVRTLNTDLPVHKVLIMGDRQSGKSSFFGRLLGKGYDPSVYKEDTTVNMGFRMFSNAAMVPMGSIEVSKEGRMKRGKGREGSQHT